MSLQKAVYGFVPTSITGCTLWLDGADTSSSSMTLTGNTVNTWKDKSGNGYNYTQTSYSTTLPPLSNIKTGTGVYFGSQQGLYNTSFPFPTSYTIFSVANQTTNYGGYQYILHSPYNADYIIFFGSLNGNFATFTGSGGWNDVNANSPSSSIATTSNTASILCCTNNGTTLTPYFNSVAMSTKTGTNAAATGMTLGDTDTAHPRQPWLGTVGEIIIFNSVIGTTERQQVEGYLAQKWGLTDSLPASHPGRSTTLYRSDYTKQNVMTARPYFTAFSPRQISGCALWLDAADSSTITMATGVSQWNDKSGNGYNLTQGSTGSQPTRTGNLLNFVTNYNMNIPQAAINNASTWSMFFAVNPIASVNWFMAKQRDGVNSYNIFSTTQTGGPGPNAYFTGLTNYLYVRMFNAGTLAASSAALTMSQLQILSFVYDGTNMLIYINGNLSSTTAGSFAIQNDTSSTNFLLGQWFGNGTNYNSNGNFQLGELIYFNSSLIATQRQRVESYLAQKWRLTSSLPGGHLHLTQPAGARTALSLVNSKMSLARISIIATGGTITTVGSFKFHTFTYPGGTFTVTANPSTVQVLVVGGGGGGGGYYNGGGGGAGGAVFNSAFSISNGSYTVTVGNGGTGASGGNNPGINGNSGTASSFSTLTGNGGGGGGADNNVNGLTGGCGGGMGPLGATAPGSGNQGYAGGYGTNGPNMGTLGGAYGSGYGGGGGGGMGSVGSNALTSAGPGWGGTGFTYVVGGQNYLVAGGGGGGTADTNNTNFGLGGSSIGGVGGLNTARVAGNGTANTGSGGGGYGRVGTGSAGGTGGTGIVIIAYRV
jgi:hypothetical protein